jgi:hypothetical protein
MLYPRIDYTSEDEMAAVRTAFGEARSMGLGGERLTLWTLRNRLWMNQSLWHGWEQANTLHNVCHANGQFSCWSLRSFNEENLAAMLDLRAGAEAYQAISAQLRLIMAGGDQIDPTQGATYYFADTMSTPEWAKGQPISFRSPPHTFYSLYPDGRLIPPSAFMPQAPSPQPTVGV